jgi:hypothetical protein
MAVSEVKPCSRLTLKILYYFKIGYASPAKGQVCLENTNFRTEVNNYDLTLIILTF